MAQYSYVRMVMEAYRSADGERNGLLSLQEILVLINRLNLGLAPDEVKLMFNVCFGHRSVVCSLELNSELRTRI